VLGDAVTGAQIPNLITGLKVAERPGDDQNAKWKRLFSAVAARQNKQQDGQPLLRLVADVMAPVRFGTQAEFDTARALINERLLLYGFEVRGDGKDPSTVCRDQSAARCSRRSRRWIFA